MILSTMKPEEMLKELREDYWELYNTMHELSEHFIRQTKHLHNKRRCYLPPSGSQKQVVSKKNRNVWTMEWHTMTDRRQRLQFSFITYTTYTDRSGKTHYVSIGTPYLFVPMIFTAHFLKRFRERYVEPNQIKTGGTSWVTYYLTHCGDEREIFYFPKDWTAEDRKTKRVFHNKFGLSVVIRNDILVTYVTFLGEECLTEYKAQLFQEESLMTLFKQLAQLEDNAVDNSDVFRRYSLLKKIISYPNAQERLIYFFRRYRHFVPEDQKPKVDETIKVCEERWATFCRCVNAFDESTGEIKAKKIVNDLFAYMLARGGKCSDGRKTRIDRTKLFDMLLNPEKQKFIAYQNLNKDGYVLINDDK